MMFHLVNSVPLHEHDCIHCIYLGSDKGNDLYICIDEPTIVSRRSSEGSDYSSGWTFSIAHEGLRHGMRLAIPVLDSEIKRHVLAGRIDPAKRALDLLIQAEEAIKKYDDGQREY